MHDLLTGLAAGALLRERSRRASGDCSSGSWVAAAYGEPDGLEQVNDARSRRARDTILILRTTADRLRSVK
jgi:hypothetical protein